MSEIKWIDSSVMKETHHYFQGNVVQTKKVKHTYIFTSSFHYGF